MGSTVRKQMRQIAIISIAGGVRKKLSCIVQDMTLILLQLPHLTAPRHHQNKGKERVACHIVLPRKCMQSVHIHRSRVQPRLHLI